MSAKTTREVVLRVAVALAVAGSALALSVGPAAAAGNRSVTVVARDFRFDGVPRYLPAGTYDLRFFNASRTDEHEFVGFNLGPDCSARITTLAQLRRLAQQVNQSPDPEAEFNRQCPGNSFAGAAYAPPLARDSQSLTLERGRLAYFCFIPEPDGTPHYELGMIGLAQVG